MQTQTSEQAEDVQDIAALVGFEFGASVTCLVCVGRGVMEVCGEKRLDLGVTSVCVQMGRDGAG